jgi:hypothetical protein
MIRDKLLPFLIRDYAFKESGDFLRQGECPACGKRELYTSAAHPWVLRCGRLNKCGAEYHVKELYPDLFNDWSRLYPVTPQSVTATADAYLADGRGFDLKRIRGWYTQESYFDPRTRAGSATVRFAIGQGAAWERLIDRPERFGAMKARFIGKYGGLWWQPPGDARLPTEIWLAEGIFDAIALLHHGLDAVSILSSVNYPSAALASLAERCADEKKPRPTLIWALDDDAAGKKATWKSVERARKEGWEASAALPARAASLTSDKRDARKIDWNDLHQRDRLGADDLAAYRHAGKILLSRTASEKACLLWQARKQAQYPFDFGKRLFWAKQDGEAFTESVRNYQDDGMSREEAEEQALKETLSVKEICNCRPTPLYYLASAVTGEAWYYFRVDFPHDGAAIKETFTPAQLSAAAEFKKRLLSFPGAVWTGNGRDLDRLVEQWTYNIKRVETLDFLGYSLTHEAYVFNDIAVQRGKPIEANAEDYFDIGKTAIRALSRVKTLNISRDAPVAGWFDKFFTVFGDLGVIALAFWLGCLFAEQIRNRFESFPFLEIVGEPGAGKTTLLETLWKLMGRAAYEGFDPMKASSVGFLRTMAQFSNLPVVLIESDREDTDGRYGRARQQFHWDNLKSLYNGGSLRTTGVKSGGNDTHDPQFRGALVISQNNAVQASAAIMERIVHLAFDKSHQSETGRQAATELGRMGVTELSGWILRALKSEKQVLSGLESGLLAAEKSLAARGVKNQRIQKNYGTILVMIAALPLSTPISKEQVASAIDRLSKLAIEREGELARDHPIVERFWEVYEYLNGTGAGSAEDETLDLIDRLNHSRDRGLIAVNLNHFVQEAAEARQQIPDLSDLKKYLGTSRQHKFVAANVVVSSIIHARYNQRIEAHQPPRPASIRCWVFKA